MEAAPAHTPLNILLVHVWFWPHVGGGDQHVEHLGRELVKLGHQVTVWCADVPSHEEKVFERGGMSVVRLVPSRVVAGVDPMVSTRHLDIAGFDVIHLHDTLPWLIRQVAKRASKAGVPIVTTYHNDYIKTTLSGRVLKRIRWVLQGRRTLHSSAARIVLTPFFENLLRQKGVRGVLDVIPNGFAPIAVPAVIPPMLSDRDSGRPLLCFVGRLSEQKGLDVLIDAWDLLAGDGDRGFDLAIAGKGELTGWLDKRHAGCRFPENVTVLGLVSEAEKRWVYENSAGVLIPSRFEGLPTVLLEAMHAGTPVVMADVNGLGGLIDDAGAGISFESADVQGLAAAMSLLVSTDEEQRATWSKQGRATAEDYLWSAVTCRVLSVYQRVVNRV